jgi:hypothetical protein
MVLRSHPFQGHQARPRALREETDFNAKAPGREDAKRHERINKLLLLRFFAPWRHGAFALKSESPCRSKLGCPLRERPVGARSVTLKGVAPEPRGVGPADSPPPWPLPGFVQSLPRDHAGSNRAGSRALAAGGASIGRPRCSRRRPQPRWGRRRRPFGRARRARGEPPGPHAAAGCFQRIGSSLAQPRATPPPDWIVRGPAGADWRPSPAVRDLVTGTISLHCASSRAPSPP